MPANFKYDGDRLPYTPGSDTVAGTTVDLQNGRIGVVTEDIRSAEIINRTGSIAIKGVVEVPKNVANDPFVLGDRVNITAGAAPVATTNAIGAHMAAEAAAAGKTTVRVLLNQFTDVT
jgi:predicted RecA/RadA family phage recombinase